MDDYYEIVGADRTASRDELDRKLREQLRLWQRRTSNADLERRQEAERRVQLLGEARGVLLDDEKRRRYDRQLIAYRSSDAPPTSPTSPTPGSPDARSGSPDAGSLDPASTNWLDQARRYLAGNDHQSAAYAARETLRTTPNPPAEVWTILARANTAMGRLDDALFEARRAATTGGDLEAQLALAAVHEQREEWHDARQAYEAAVELDPRAEAPQVGLARALVRSGQGTEVVDQLERRYTQATDPGAGRRLARALVKAAEALVQVPGTSGYRVHSSAQIHQVRRMLRRAREVSSDPALVRAATELERYVDRHDRAPSGPQRRATPVPVGPAGRPAGRPTGRAGTVAPAGPAGPTNAIAVVAMVCAIIGMGTCLTAPLGAVLGHVARPQIRERGERGEGLAVASIVMGWIATAAWCCGGLVYVNVIA